ncbi:hypothetical protein PSV3_00270 [Septimatrevirus PSV33]|uniref:Uncharacterized protein n=1 Tax=Pseudomonas phage PSV3 TaxID=3003632 RepID=A0AAE9VW95_9CAUD|nr:hypothetical protein ORF041 [Pseudomonas phage 73]YP_010598021.1 hypothetical protein PM406_gp71 [Pseudomonas phage PSV3]WBF76972.1 hypothetical protein PSV3_00270 [Pseudomonas phage PSV3]
MQILLQTNPNAGTFQAEFERIMLLIGWCKGVLAISECGSYYLNEDVSRHWQAFLFNKNDI